MIVHADENLPFGVDQPFRKLVVTECKPFAIESQKPGAFRKIANRRQVQRILRKVADVARSARL